jgi:hypothetical protein
LQASISEAPTQSFRKFDSLDIDAALLLDDLFFAESTLAHDSSSDPGRVILNGESHISNGLVSGRQVSRVFLRGTNSNLHFGSRKLRNFLLVRLGWIMPLFMITVLLMASGPGMRSHKSCYPSKTSE